MLARTIQRQVTIGEDVRFLRKDGQEIAGRLIELSQDHITLDSSGKHITIMLDVIGGWEVMPVGSPPKEEITDIRTNEVKQEEDATAKSEQESDSDARVESAEHPSDNNREEALKTTLEIEARFQAKIAATDLAPLQPGFDLSAERHKAKQVLPELDRIKSKYEYALKVNELGAQFGRIQPLIAELEKLATRHRNLSIIFRLLGYFRWLVNDLQKSAEMYKTAAQISNSANDWYGFAALADNDALKFYGLNRAYAQSCVSEYVEAWCFYISLVHKHKAHSALVDLSSNQKNIESEQARKCLLEACLFLLTKAGNGVEATSLASRELEGEDIGVLVEEANRAIEILSDEFSTDYVEAIKSFGSMQPQEQRQVPTAQLPAKVQQGSIYAYKTDRIFGFIRGVDGKTYFFHRSAVSDEELREQLREFTVPIEVAFESTEGPKGPIALNILLPRVTEQIYERAVDFAENGDYAHAIHEIKKVLNQNPDFPSAAELHEKWREYARISIVPRGSNPYARAKRVQLIEKDLDKAAEYFQIAIQENDHLESAVKDLAVLHTQKGNPNESVKILQQYRKQITDRRSVDNMLVNFHLKAGQYDETIKLLQVKLHQATSNIQKARTQMQIASCYLQKEDFSKAKSHYKKVIRLRPSMLSAHRNIALCAFKLGEYVEAERILSDILDTSTDLKAEELLEAIRQERAGQQSNIDEIILEVTLPSLSNETSKFTEFFLERCDFYGVRPARVKEVQEGKAKFNRRDDVQPLEGFARQSGTTRPRERAEYYLSAAKILLTMEDSDQDEIYKLLGRSFALRADAALVERKRLDAARDLYAESLSIYDGYRGGSSDDQEASNALVRFLYSTLGESRIPTTPDIPSVDETLDTVLSAHNEPNRVFSAIAYLTFRSPRFAASRILGRLNNKPKLKTLAIKYLESQ